MATDLRDFSRSLPMALMRARERVMREFRPLLAEHDLSEQQWRTLRALAATQAPIEVAEIAERTFLLGPSVSRILGNLESRGLIERQTVATDQRRAAISLSAKGRALVERIAPESESRYADIEQRFGTERLAELYLLLDELALIEETTDRPTTRR